MVDTTRSSLTLALLLFTSILPPVTSAADDRTLTAAGAPCPPADAGTPGECDPLPISREPETGPAGSGLGPALVPSVQETPPPLPPLTPVAPSRRDPAMQSLERSEAAADTTAAQPAPEAPAAPDGGASQPGPTAASADARHRAREARLASGLSWDYCGPKPGVTRLDPGGALSAADDRPIDITADWVDYDRNRDLIQLRGDILMVQGERRLEADRSSYDRRTGEVTAAGDVYLEYPERRLTADRAELNLETRKGVLSKTQYRLSGSANLRGEADRAWMLSDQLSRYRDILYTTCPPGRSDWSIKASELELDQASGIGTARHARIRIADVPVLYSPYLSFPLDSRRRSGFLIPTFGSSDETGTDISLPYYWNIAPNMDATLTPRYMSTRGLMLGTQLRHLAGFQELEVDAEVLPRDRKDPDEGLRGALRVKQTGRLGARWWSSVDYATVSDDRYLEDFGNRLDVTSVRNLTQRADLNYVGDGWRLLTRVQDFQTVDASIAPADRPYGQLPHIELRIDPKEWKGLVEYSLEGQYDYFDHNAAVHGGRLVAVPSVRVPLRRGFGYLIPRARLYYTSYDLVDQTEGLSNDPTHLIPSIDLDGKLIFERETSWMGTDSLQTLEPRLYYVLTAYEDQSETPRFDTTALDFSFASLFRPNRFTGYDRIGDENRLTLGLTSRTIASRSGEQLFRASVGQIYYFDKRRVQLSGDGIENDISSSVAGELSARLHRDWSALASLQWNPNQTEQPWEKQVIQLRYSPGDDRLLNLAYRFNLGDDSSEEYEDTDVSFQMPLGSKVKLVGRWLYSMLNNETVEAFAGIEIGRCCWRLRLLGQHLKRSADSTGSTSIMLQLELAGLGSFGNQIDKLLERGIYGYQTD